MKRLLQAILLGTSLFLNPHGLAQSPFKIAYFDNYAPYSWLDDDGNMRGIFIDILDEVIGNRMKRPIQHAGFPWARAQQYVRLGDYDAMVAPITNERKSYTHISDQPVLNSRMAIFTKASHPRMLELERTRSIDDVKTFDFVTQLGDGWARENLSAMNVQYVSDLDTVLRMLSQDRAELFIEESLVTHWNLKNLGLADKIAEVAGVTIEVTPYHLMISNKSDHQFTAEFDKHLTAYLQSGEMQRLLDSYRQ